MGLLADVFSYGNTMKRKVNGLLDDPRATLEQFVGQLGDDTNTNIRNMQQGYGFGGKKATDPAQVAAAQKALADYGSQAGMAAATVWHGSPHKFDKFDSSKIGTGEGAQAYGHGLYFAESPDVAKSYLATGQAVKAADRPTEMVARAIDASGGDEAAARVWLKNRLNTSPPDYKEIYSSALKGFDSLKPQGSSLYKVDLPDEHIAKMLDWDKPLSQQHPDVQAIFGKSEKMTGSQALKAIEANPEQYFSQTMSGKDLTGAMIRPERGSSEFLRQKGIPGIRYLDAGSRATGGTSNFVVFPGNENLLQILERNGQPIKGLLGQ